MCSSITLVAWVNQETIENITSLPIQPTPANRTTYSQIMKIVRAPDNNRRHTITVYCPPRMRYLHMAACFAHTDPNDRYRNPRRSCCIRIDDRLLDQSIAFQDIPGRMQQYQQDVENALQDPSLGNSNFAHAIDLSWLERRLDELYRPGYEPIPETLDWNTIFRASRDDSECVAIIVLGGENACEAMLNTEPVLPPDYFRGEKRIYRLSPLKNHIGEILQYKAEHYCNIATDKKFDQVTSPVSLLMARQRFYNEYVVEASEARRKDPRPKTPVAHGIGEAYLPTNPLGLHLSQSNQIAPPTFQLSPSQSTSAPSRVEERRSANRIASSNLRPNSSTSSLILKEPLGLTEPDHMLAFKDAFNRLSPTHSPSPSPSVSSAALALFDYKTFEDDQLSFPKGAEITNVVSSHLQSVAIGTLT